MQFLKKYKDFSICKVESWGLFLNTIKILF